MWAICGRHGTWPSLAVRRAGYEEPWTEEIYQLQVGKEHNAELLCVESLVMFFEFAFTLRYVQGFQTLHFVLYFKTHPHHVVHLVSLYSVII